MSNLTYYISASHIGTGYESTDAFQFFYDICGDGDYLVNSTGGSNIFNATDLTQGLELSIPAQAEFLYLLPLSERCPLGCNYLFKHTLSNYTPVTPTPTPTPTVTATPGITPTPTPTPTPSTSGPPQPEPYGTHTFSHTGGTITIDWPTSTPYFTKYSYASQLANYLAGTTVSVTTNESTPVEKNLDFSFQVYEEDLVTIAYDVNDNFNSTVWWYANYSQNIVFLKVTNVSVGDPQGYGPSLAGELGYLEG